MKKFLIGCLTMSMIFSSFAQNLPTDKSERLDLALTVLEKIVDNEQLKNSLIEEAFKDEKELNANYTTGQIASGGGVLVGLMLRHFSPTASKSASKTANMLKTVDGFKVPVYEIEGVDFIIDREKNTLMRPSSGSYSKISALKKTGLKTTSIARKGGNILIVAGLTSFIVITTMKSIDDDLVVLDEEYSIEELMNLTDFGYADYLQDKEFLVDEIIQFGLEKQLIK